jgi:hypothetical protein
VIGNRRHAAWLILILLVLASPNGFAKSGRDDDSSPNPSQCHPQALVTADNDMRLNGDDRPPGRPVAMPAVVIKRLQNAARLLIAQFPPGTTAGLGCKDLFRDTYRISLAEGRQLFVAENLYRTRYQLFLPGSPRSAQRSRNSRSGAHRRKIIPRFRREGSAD